MKVNITQNQIIAGLVTFAVAWYIIRGEHHSGDRLDKAALVREIAADKQAARDNQFHKKMEQTIALTLSNQKNSAVIEHQFTTFEMSITALTRSVDTLNNDIQNLTRDYLTKSEFQTALDKVESNTKASINRLGEVMYNDRQQFDVKLERNTMGIDGNTRDLQYLRGALNLPTYRQMNNQIIEPHEKIILSK